MATCLYATVGRVRCMPATRRRTFLGLFQPESQQIGVEFVHQRDRGHRHTGTLAGGNDLCLKLATIAAPSAPSRWSFFVDSIY